MDLYSRSILRLLDATIGDAGLPSQLREQAAYISASFADHDNIFRLMAQVSALFNGGMLIHPSHRPNDLNEDAQVPVHRHSAILQAIVNDHRLSPTVADFEGHPIELISILDPAIQTALVGEKIFELHEALIMMERVANEDLARYTRQYGYHYIFRAGLNQYYMTKAVAGKVNFLRQDPRGDEYRAQAQKLCYEAMESRPNLNDAEKTLVVRATNCVPEDAHRFWNWLVRNRASYRAMKACLSLLDRLECQCIHGYSKDYLNFFSEFSPDERSRHCAFTVGFNYFLERANLLHEPKSLHHLMKIPTLYCYRFHALHPSHLLLFHPNHSRQHLPEPCLHFAMNMVLA